MTVNLFSKRWTQIGFLAIVILFNLCLVAQLLTVGLAVFYDPSWWSIHIWLVRGYSGLITLLCLVNSLKIVMKAIAQPLKPIIVNQAFHLWTTRF
jgi:hypothetical protein